MKIVSARSLGVHPTFSPEMRSERHNYITDASPAVHRNSHAVAYCLIAYRCLWLKAHHTSEWWAAVMSDCHPDKLARYMGVAKSEGVRFVTFNIDHLTINFTVTGEDVNQGLIGLKRVGMSAAKAYEYAVDRNASRPRGETNHHYRDIDEFIADHPKNKTVMERLIKLGSFSHLHGEGSRYGLWNWYLYRYGSGKEATEIRRYVRQRLLEESDWNEFAIKQERKRQTEEYRLRYPKRDKIPEKILNWTPKPEDDRDSVLSLFPIDYSTPELLTFEKEYLGYYMSNPLERYNYNKLLDIKSAKRAQFGVVHAVVMRVDFGTTKKGDEMCRVTLYDGKQSALLLLWSDDCELYRPILARAQEALTREVKQKTEPGVKPKPQAPKYEVGVLVNVRYSSAKDKATKSFTLTRQNAAMSLLPPTKTKPTHVST